VYKEIFRIIILFSLLLSTENFSQEKELFDLIITDENATPELLPERIIFTQKIFWGENGIFEDLCLKLTKYLGILL
jgi:hypothetical protein